MQSWLFLERLDFNVHKSSWDCESHSRTLFSYPQLEALLGLIPTSNMALKQWFWTAEMAPNDSKIGWNCDSDRKKRTKIVKYKQQHGFLLNVRKDDFIKVRLGTYYTPSRHVLFIAEPLNDFSQVSVSSLNFKISKLVYYTVRPRR